MLLFPCFFAIFTFTINENALGEILTFEKSAITSSATSKPSEHSGEQTHLSLSSLFSQSNKYKCMIEGKKELCTYDDVKYLKDKFGDSATHDQTSSTVTITTKDGEPTHNQKEKVFGPRNQPIHLTLPFKVLHEVGYKEELSLNGRNMQVTTLSRLPHIFEVTNFLSVNETDLIVDMATEKGLKERTSKQHTVALWEEMDHRLFDSWDTDIDGKVSLDEMMSLKLFDPYLLTNAEFEKLISVIDEDKDGFLSYGELSNDSLNKMKTSLQEREQLRSERKRQGGYETWLWHDEDELLSYEDLLEDFHQRQEEI